jgi:aryl-alcohol dehydrogenase-like predicted oxidoreductase
MKSRPLGRSGLSTAPVVLGGNVFGWTADRATSFRLLDAAVDAGFTLVDTADVYSAWVPGHKGGESETVIGEWLAARGPAVRGKLLITTKVGMLGARNGLSRATINAACDDSLKRLGIDVIDLYQAHRDDDATPLAETLAAFGELVAAGKVRAIGASNYTADRLRAALDTSAAQGSPRYETLQPLYNLYERNSFEGNLQSLCVAEDIGVIPYYGLAAGFLTGKYRSAADFGKSVRGRQMSGFLNPRGLAILAALDAVADKVRATPTQVALAWLIRRPAIAAPIASATSVEQLADLVAAMTLDLDGAAMAVLDTASTEA